jgi:hypothetical protein
MSQPKPNDEAPIEGMECCSCHLGSYNLHLYDWTCGEHTFKRIWVWSCPVCGEVIFPKETSEWIDAQWDLMDRSDYPNEIEN